MASPVLTAGEQTAFRLAMDSIVPASEEMPSATAAGGFEYLEAVMRREPEMAKEIRQALAVLEAFSNRHFERPFSQLSASERVAALTEMEKGAPTQFAFLRDCVYESYYTRPQIWKLIGYQLYPADHMGPSMKPFDESLLAEVRKRPKLYRDV